MKTLLPDTSAITVMLVVMVLASLIALVAKLLGGAIQVVHWVEFFLALTTVVLGMLVVSVSVHTLNPAMQWRSHLFVAGFGIAAVCNLLHALLVYAMAGDPSPQAVLYGLWFGSWARVAEAASMVLMVQAFTARGPARAWHMATWCIVLLLVLAVATPLPVWWAEVLDGLLRQALAGALALAFGWVGVALYRRATDSKDRLFALSALAFGCAEAAVALWGLDSAIGQVLGCVYRIVAYALLYQLGFSIGIRLPFERIQEAERRLRDTEGRLSVLGRNLPHSVLYQVRREPDGRMEFVHMGDAIERLMGVSAQSVLQDASVLRQMILAQDRVRLHLAEQESFLNRTSMEILLCMHHAGGDVRWMHWSASPRLLEDGRMLWDGVQTDMTGHRMAEQAAHAQESLMANMLRQVPGGVLRLDQDLRVLYCNEQQAQWFDSVPAQLQGKTLDELLPHDFLGRMRPFLNQAFEGETAIFESHMGRSRRTQYWHTTIAPEFTVGTQVRAVILYAYDLTELKRVELALANERALLAKVVNAMPDMVFLKDPQGIYLSVNPVFERFMGRPASQILGCSDAQFRSESEIKSIRESDERALQAWQPLVYEETLVFAEDGYRGLFETIKTPIRDLHGKVTGVLGVCRDITDRKRAEQEIERLAFFDALTGLPNRRLLLDRLQRALVACQRNHQLGALLFIDLDNFKDLNDTLGHDMGDQLLAQVAKRLADCVRESDTVARFGGDEFVVMLEVLSADPLAASAQVETVASKLLAQLNQPFDLGGLEHYSTPSIGITLFGDDRLTVDELLKRADLAMYQAKAAGRNTQRFFDPEMQAAVNARSNLEADLRQGLVRSEFMVYFQPVVDHQSRLLGAEVLVRWKHPHRGMISPAEFIPVAEQTGLILPLGAFVLQSACRQLQRWSLQPHTAQLNLSVNVSARQFRQAGFVSQVMHTLGDYDANPRRLKLELTESMLLGDVEDTIERMEQLKAQGVGFALDDFGTGYSSLSYLKRLPLDQIKIDQSFVRDVLTDPNDAAIVRTILALAKSLDLEVVAEGVETAGQLTFLRLHGCEAFQGYLFGRPTPIDVFEREQIMDLAPSVPAPGNARSNLR